MELNRVQMASSALSLCWKKESEKLLNGASDFDEFKNAVIWCGKVGNVMRTVPKQYVEEFVNFLWKEKGKIMSGELSLSRSLKEYGGKTPYSWASKVCHIMNPKGYPLIYDANIRKTYKKVKIRTITDYEAILSKVKIELTEKSNDEIYKYDSDLWASIL